MKDASGHGSNPRNGTFDEKVTDALTRCHAAHRALAIARESQQRQHMHVHGVHLIDDCVDALVKQVESAEALLVKLLSEAGGTIHAHGWALTASVSDRRRKMRPKFVLHKLNPDAPTGRRAPAPMLVL